MKILVVDDDPDLLFLVAHGVKSISPAYQVMTAEDGPTALAQVGQQNFDLIITDYMMPEMSGLDLVQAAREVGSDAKFVLMTAHHDTSHIHETIQDIGLSGFVGKPFTMPDLLNVIKQTIEPLEASARVPMEENSTIKDGIKEQLQGLHGQTGAHTVLLVNSKGTPVYGAGQVDREKALRLASFVSSNFLSIIELASLFGDNESTFKSSYYEGNQYNIYVHVVNSDFFLAVVFGTESKPGTIWFYTRQTAEALADMLPNTKHELSQQDSLDLVQDFENILGV